MSTILNPYLSFRDNARQAMEFYRSALGGELVVNTFGDSSISDDPADRDKVMHAMLTTPTGLVLMGADTPNSMAHTPGNNVAVSLSGDDEAELRGYWDRISDGATITARFERAPWGDTFGMCTDKFGIHWMVNVSGTPAA